MKAFRAVSNVIEAASNSVINLCKVSDEVTGAAAIYASDLKLAAISDVAINSEQRAIDLFIGKAAHAKQRTELENL